MGMTMSEITEYQKVAALLCSDIDLMVSAAERRPDLALGLLKKLQTMKNDLISESKVRDSRYSASCAVLSLAVKHG